ncbi:hypothetical protein M2283_001083 [Streptomyces pseudovenezuelae]|uniref:Transposase n=1 Tax=Streptomyces pseudovenezuelae TaxID=67350 RepID=A0ABT6LBX4_9ACTN|nr:hypothetical protein [Streptomyces pseudovenezuelae]
MSQTREPLTIDARRIKVRQMIRRTRSLSARAITDQLGVSAGHRSASMAFTISARASAP